MFSIIIPTRNRNNTLDRCLQALFIAIDRVDKIPSEVIITVDEEIEDITKVTNRFANVRMVQGPRKGPAANRNNGAKFASEDWLVFLDDDCEPKPDLILSYINAINENTKIQVFEGAILPDGEKKTGLDYAPLNISGGNLWSCNFCIDRKLFQSLGGFDESFIYPHMEDIDFRTRLFNLNIPFSFVPNAAVVHPWRRIKSGIVLGKYQEMYVLYHEKHHKPYSLSKLLLEITLFHLSMCRNTNSIFDFIISIWSLIEHISVVLLKWNSWKKKYLYER
jgi:GT2 family glycosyltransferase